MIYFTLYCIIIVNRSRMILPEAQLYGGNILEAQVMELTRYYLRPRGTVAKIVPGKSLPGI